MRRSSRREDTASSSSKKRSTRDTGGRFGASKRRDDSHRRRTETSERPARSRYYQSSRAALDEVGLRPDVGGPSAFSREPPLAAGSPVTSFSPFSGSNPFADDTAARRLQLFWAVQDGKKKEKKKRLMEAASLSWRRQARQLSDVAAAGEMEEEGTDHPGHVSLEMEQTKGVEPVLPSDRAATVPRRSQGRSRWSRLFVADSPQPQRSETRLTMPSEAEEGLQEEREQDPAALQGDTVPRFVGDAGSPPSSVGCSTVQARQPPRDPTTNRHSQASNAGQVHRSIKN